MKKYNIFVGIPVYNEYDTIEECIKSVVEAQKKLENHYNVTIAVCCNGTSDGTNIVVEEIRKEYDNIGLYYSEKGKTKAIVKLLEENREADIGVFIDGDRRMDHLCLYKIVNTIVENQHLYCVYGNPIFKESKSVLAKILNIRRQYSYTQLAPFLLDGIEERNFIHGRIFSLKQNIFDDIIESSFTSSKGDDTYLSHFLIHNYGRKSFAEIDDAYVYYTPIQSLTGWWDKNTRIWSDMDNIYTIAPEFKYLKKYMGCKID